jgi:hypothetical protein
MMTSAHFPACCHGIATSGVEHAPASARCAFPVDAAANILEQT